MPLGRKSRKKLILVKRETVYGQDAGPTALADAILTRNAQFTDWQGDTEERNTDRPTLGNEIEYHTSVHAMLQFEVEFVGHGSTADSLPPWDAVMTACGASSTVNVGTSVVYAPVDDNFESATIYFNWDGKQYVMLGCRGNCRVMLNAASNPYFMFTFMGLRANPTDVPIPLNPDYSGFNVPVAVNSNNTTFSLAGQTGTDIRMSTFEIDFGNQVIHRDVVGQDAIEITDRRPSATVTIEDGLVADYNWDNDVENHNLVLSNLTHEDGTVGRDLELVLPKVQLLRPTYPDQEGNIGIQFQMKLIPDTGLDEWTITQT